MGSYYGTCGISNLPLISEKVVMLPIKQKRSTWEELGADFCYPYGRWQPCGIPVYGTYYDYGQITLDKQQEEIQKFNAAILQSTFIETDKGTKEDLLNFDKYEEMIHQGTLKVSSLPHWKTGDKESLSIGRVLIVRKIWDALINSVEKDYNDVVRSPEYFIQNLVTRLNCESSFEDSMLDHMLALRDMSGTTDFRTFHPLKERYKTDKGETTQAMIQQFAEFYSMSYCMYGLRKHWSPQAGSGSQDCDYQPYRVLNAAMEEVMKDWEKECDS